jgi:hypothetical protein
MTTKKAKTIHRRTCYGLNATVAIGSGFIHKAGFGDLLIPHPPVINWLLRQGLTRDEQYALSFTHEFGYLQSTPLALLYAVTNIAVAFATGYPSLAKIILLLIGAHAAWEGMSEIFTIITDTQSHS